MITNSMIETLKEDATLVAIHDATIVKEVALKGLYDIDYEDRGDIPDLMMEPGDQVIVTEHTGGLYYMHFLSLQSKRYHYRSPWTEDDQVTHDEGAIYHV